MNTEGSGSNGVGSDEERGEDGERETGQIFRALRHRNYRLFFFGQGVSLIGTWLTRIATNWLVYRLTNSAFLLGVVGFASQIPAFFLASLAGVLIDRWDRRRTLIITQILFMAQSLTLALLAVTGRIAVWHVIVVSVLQSIVSAFDIPARQAFVVDMVDRREDLPNAIALNSSIFNGARLIGPSVAGVLIATAGEWPCFLADGVSYIAVIASLLVMRIAISAAPPHDADVWQGLKEGFAYTFGFVPIRALILLAALVNLAGMPYSVLMPVFAKDILHGGAYTFGFLVAASGVGALAGAVYLASRQSVRGLGRIIALCPALLGLALAAFALSRHLPLSMTMMVLTGFAMMVQMAGSNTILQTIVEDDKRGRVMSFYMMAFMGMMPLGSLIAGSLASTVGAPATILAGGALCVLSSAAFARKLPVLQAHIRPIYIRLGILSESDRPS